jgi:hypothetical protein
MGLYASKCSANESAYRPQPSNLKPPEPQTASAMLVNLGGFKPSLATPRAV